MDYKKMFYWLTVADNAKTLFFTISILFGAVVVISTICYFIFASDFQDEDDKRSQKMSRKWIWWSSPFCILFLSLWVFTPNKKDALLIIGGGETLNFLTTDSTAKQIPHELSSFILTELKNMGKDAKVNLYIESQKEKILDEAKNMSANEIIDRMKTDTNFANILLKK